MKRFISLLLTGALLTTAVACTQETNSGSTSTVTTTSSTTEDVPTTTTTTTTEATTTESTTTTTVTSEVLTEDTQTETTAVPAADDNGDDDDDASDVTTGTDGSDVTSDTSVGETLTSGDDDDDVGLGDINVERINGEVHLTMPAEIVGDQTVEQVLADDSMDVISATKNADGSMTIVMTEEEHKRVLDNFVTEMNTQIEEIVNSADYAVSKVDVSDDMTKFDVHLEGEEVGMSESFLTFTFALVSGLYQVFDGVDPQEPEITFYSASGQVVEYEASDGFDIDDLEP